MLKLATKFAPLAWAFEVALASGFSFAEFWLDAGYLCRWNEVLREARMHPLQYALHFPNRGELSDTAIIGAVELYRELGSSAMVIHAPMMERYGDRLRDIEPDLRLAVENHRITPAELETWATQHEWLTLDVEHLWKFTLGDSCLDVLIDNLEEIFTRFGRKIVHIHLPGYAPGFDEHRPMYCSREMVLRVFDLLEDFQFEGLMVSEVNRKYQNSHELKMDSLLFEHWRTTRQQLVDGPTRIDAVVPPDNAATSRLHESAALSTNWLDQS